MADLGFTELSMEPVVCAPEDPYALTEADLPVLYEQYEILAKEMLAQYNIVHLAVGKLYHFIIYQNAVRCQRSRRACADVF